MQDTKIKPAESLGCLTQRRPLKYIMKVLIRRDGSNCEPYPSHTVRDVLGSSSGYWDTLQHHRNLMVKLELFLCLRTKEELIVDSKKQRIAEQLKGYVLIFFFSESFWSERNWHLFITFSNLLVGIFWVCTSYLKFFLKKQKFSLQQLCLWTLLVSVEIMSCRSVNLNIVFTAH